MLFDIYLDARNNSSKPQTKKTRIANKKEDMIKNESTKTVKRGFYTIYELILGFSIFYASMGIIDPNFQTGRISPLHPLNTITANPLWAFMYFTFIILAIRFFMGSSVFLHPDIATLSTETRFKKWTNKYRVLSPFKDSPVVFSGLTLKFLFFFIQSVGFLGISAAIVSRSISGFFSWFLAVIVIDILLIMIFLNESYNQTRKFVIMDRGLRFWLGTDMLWIMLSLLVEPTLYSSSSITYISLVCLIIEFLFVTAITFPFDLDLTAKKVDELNHDAVEQKEEGEKAR